MVGHRKWRRKKLGSIEIQSNETSEVLNIAAVLKSSFSVTLLRRRISTELYVVCPRNAAKQPPQPPITSWRSLRHGQKLCRSAVISIMESTTTTQGDGPQANNATDPEEALLPELGFSPSRILPVEIAAQHHLHNYATGGGSAQDLDQGQQQQLHQATLLGYATGGSTQELGHDAQQRQQQQPNSLQLDHHQHVLQSQHLLPHQQDPLNALTTLAVAAAPPRNQQQQQSFTLLDVVTGPHPQTIQQQQQQAAAFGFQDGQSNAFTLDTNPEPQLNMDDPAALAAALAAKDKEIKALRRALNKAQRRNPNPAARDFTASMIGEAVLNIQNREEPEENQIDPNQIKNLAERWKARFQQLVRYKLKHGDCNVPKGYSDAPLHAWVRKQRINKQIRDKSGGIKGLTKEQVAALDSIGFQWFIGHQCNDVSWQANYERLVQLYAVHGYIPTHCSDKSLTKWMQNQRARRKLLEAHGEGKARGMNWERVQKLDAIGFTWYVLTVV